MDKDPDLELSTTGELLCEECQYNNFAVLQMDGGGMCLACTQCGFAFCYPELELDEQKMFPGVIPSLGRGH
jgi:hypothetical protein